MDDLRAAFQSRLAQTSPWPLALDIVHAEGCWLTARDGKRYLDLVAGLAVNNVGHRHPKVVEAIKQQAERYLHVIPYGEFIQEPQVRFAERLTGQLPAGLDCAYFVNSGTEAIEGALKLAKRATGRTRLIGCTRSYHGSTHGSLSLTDNEVKKYRNRPLLPDTEHITFDDFDDLERIDDRTAAVVVEPVQGDAGVRVPDPTWLLVLRQRCSEAGALLIYDEVQTGFGRTGKPFAFEHAGAVPDILVLGKALGGGLPMGAFVSSTERMRLFTHHPVLGHITTFGGHPLACAAGLAALEVMLQEGLPAHAEAMGRLFRDRLRHSAIREVRGLGLMLAVELGDPGLVQRVVHGALHRGVLGFWFLSCPSAFRIAPPLTLAPAEVEQACTVLLQALDEALDQPSDRHS
jgi:acetylornithine/succinyldiaminopimelate/putrescine aminotransferase